MADDRSFRDEGSFVLSKVRRNFDRNQIAWPGFHSFANEKAGFRSVSQK
jgi:hypothetical protein